MRSVWDFPRPPAVEPCARRARVVVGGETVADSIRALEVLETSHPPTLYLPREDFAPGVLQPSRGAPRSLCEFQGMAEYLDVAGAHRAGWHSPSPVAAYAALAGHVAIYPGRVEACYLGEERVAAQDGDFYGGWVTADLEGPFKGGPGTRGW